MFIIQSRHNIFSKYKTKGSLLAEAIGGLKKELSNKLKVYLCFCISNCIEYVVVNHNLTRKNNAILCVFDVQGVIS